MMAGVLALHLLLIPILYYAVIAIVGNEIRTRFVNDVRANGHLLAEIIASFLIDRNTPAVRELLDELLLTGTVIYAEVATTDGVAIRPAETRRPTPFVEDFFFGEHGDQRYHIAMPVYGAGGGELGVLRLTYDESATHAQIATVKGRSLAIIGGYGGLSILLVLFFGRRLTRPLERLRDAARRVAVGEDTVDLHASSEIREVTSLAHDLNRMRLALIATTHEATEREARLLQIMENASDGIIILDERGIVQSFNVAAQSIFGASAAEIVGTDVRELLPSFATTATGPAAPAPGPGLPAARVFETNGLRRDGSGVAVELSLSELRLGMQYLCTLIVRDISQRRRAEAALRTSERLKSSLVDAMSHDLRMPLTAIKASVTALSAEHAEGARFDQAERRELLEVIEQETDHINRFIECLVDLARIDAGDLQLRPVWSTIPEIVERALARAQGLIRAHRVECDIDADLPRVNADPRAIAEILYSLIDNAAKYSAPGSSILVSAKRRDAGLIEIAVEDEGHGVPVEVRDRVFERWFRTTGAAAGDPGARKGGAGLGLAIAHSFVEAHGGRIYVADGLRLAGARFCFTLPTAAQARAPEPEAVAA
jgi:PAS domain S-box-containing protein